MSYTKHGRTSGESEFSWGPGLTPMGFEDAPASQGGRYRGMARPWTCRPLSQRRPPGYSVGKQSSTSSVPPIWWLRRLPRVLRVLLRRVEWPAVVAHETRAPWFRQATQLQPCPTTGPPWPVDQWCRERDQGQPTQVRQGQRQQKLVRGSGRPVQGREDRRGVQDAWRSRVPRERHRRIPRQSKATARDVIPAHTQSARSRIGRARSGAEARAGPARSASAGRKVRR